MPIWTALAFLAARSRCPAALWPPGEAAPPLPPRYAGGVAAGPEEGGDESRAGEELWGEATKWGEGRNLSVSEVGVAEKEVKKAPGRLEV